MFKNTNIDSTKIIKFSIVYSCNNGFFTCEFTVVCNNNDKMYRAFELFVNRWYYIIGPLHHLTFIDKQFRVIKGSDTHLSLRMKDGDKIKVTVNKILNNVNNWLNYKYEMIDRNKYINNAQTSDERKKRLNEMFTFLSKHWKKIDLTTKSNWMDDYYYFLDRGLQRNILFENQMR